MAPKVPSWKIPRDLHEHARDVVWRLMRTKGFLKSRDKRKRVEMRFAHLKTYRGFERMRLCGGYRIDRHPTHRSPEADAHDTQCGDLHDNSHLSTYNVEKGNLFHTKPQLEFLLSISFSPRVGAAFAGSVRNTRELNAHEGSPARALAVSLSSPSIHS